MVVPAGPLSQVPRFNQRQIRFVLPAPGTQQAIIAAGLPDPVFRGIATQ
jgi:hypothetical protein